MLRNVNKNVLTEVYEVHDSVDPGLGEDDPADQLVEVDVVVQGQDGGQPEVPEQCDQVGRNVVSVDWGLGGGRFNDQQGKSESSPKR